MSRSGELDDQGRAARRVLGLMDLTSLNDDDDQATIDRLCDDAVTPFGSVPAVCVWPRFVAQAVQRLSGTGIAVAAVANFPQGDDDPALAVSDAEAIVAAGGREIDVVLPWRSLSTGDGEAGLELVQATRQAIGPELVLKVILETGELIEPALIGEAARIALEGGADFLKTSTGKTERSATPEAARCLLEVLSDGDHSAGLKISGGVRTVEQARIYLDMADEMMGPDWVTASTFRFGASGLLRDVLGVLDSQH